MDETAVRSGCVTGLEVHKVRFFFLSCEPRLGEQKALAAQKQQRIIAARPTRLRRGKAGLHRTGADQVKCEPFIHPQTHIAGEALAGIVRVPGVVHALLQRLIDLCRPRALSQRREMGGGSRRR